MSTQVASDLMMFNLPKYATSIQLKKQYHKFAKIYHPDAGGQNSEKFKDLTEAYDRLNDWIDNRDETLTEKIRNNEAPGVEVENEDVTYTLGALKLRGKVS